MITPDNLPAYIDLLINKGVNIYCRCNNGSFASISDKAVAIQHERISSFYFNNKRFKNRSELVKLLYQPCELTSDFDADRLADDNDVLLTYRNELALLN